LARVGGRLVMPCQRPARFRWWANGWEDSENHRSARNHRRGRRPGAPKTGC